MSRLRDDEIRRLISYLRRQISDETILAEIEDTLRSDEAQEYLREPEILAYFPLIVENFRISGVGWNLRIIPHAHLRSVQRGLPVPTLASLFRCFVEFSNQQGVAITAGNYSVTARPAPRERRITVRFDVDQVTEEAGVAHVVTVVIGITTVDRDENAVEL